MPCSTAREDWIWCQIQRTAAKNIRKWRLAVAARTLPNYGPPRTEVRILGRSQVVRQRVLIPPCGGSNPPAPASHTLYFGTLSGLVLVRVVSVGYVRGWRPRDFFRRVFLSLAPICGASLGLRFSNLRIFRFAVLLFGRVPRGAISKAIIVDQMEEWLVWSVKGRGDSAPASRRQRWLARKHLCDLCGHIEKQ